MMPLPDTNTIYVITNNDAENASVLGVSTDLSTLEMVPSNNIGTNQQWFVRVINQLPFYRLHNVASGNQRSVDIINGGEADNSTGVRMFDSGEYTGQRWQFDAEDDESLRLWNNYTGNDRYLDVDQVTLELFMAAKGIDSGAQNWVFIPADDFTAAKATSGSSASGTSKSESSGASGGRISTGAIAGIAVGIGTVVIGVLVGLFILRRRRLTRAQEARQFVPETPMQGVPPRGSSVISPRTAEYCHPKEPGFAPYEMPDDRKSNLFTQPARPPISPAVELPANHQAEVHELQ